MSHFRFIELYEESKLASLIPLFLAHVIQFIREAELAVLSDPCGEMESKRTEGSEELIQSLRQTCTQLVQIVTFSARPLYMMTSEPSLMLDAGIESVPLPLPVNWSLARQITAKLGQVFVSIVDTFVGREIEVRRQEKQNSFQFDANRNDRPKSFLAIDVTIMKFVGFIFLAKDLKKKQKKTSFHFHFQVLTAALKSGKCVSAAKLAANSLMSLGSDAARPALRPLIEAFQVVHLRPVRADLLRALAALCSSADIIQEFETVYFHFIVLSFYIQSNTFATLVRTEQKIIRRCHVFYFMFNSFFFFFNLYNNFFCFFFFFSPENSAQV